MLSIGGWVHSLAVLGLVVAVPTLAAVMVLMRHILFGQVYAEQDLHRVPKAVLVEATTGERKIVVPE
jgi:predicted PurR-regulated permease PerM